MTVSAARALDLLDQIVNRQRPAGLIDLARATGLDKSTASRLLGLLCSRGLVARDDVTRLYRRGPALLQLATRALDDSAVRATAHHHLERLRDLSDETVTLQLRVGQQRVCIDTAESPQPIRRVGHFGEATPLHVGVTGKVITAFLPPEEAEPVIAKAMAAGQDLDRLQRLLETIRRRGYYASIGDKGEGIAAVSAPVMESSSVVVAALTISGPDHRWTAERMQQFAPMVMAAAREVSAALVVHG